jgi:hypothetical protein
MGNMVMSDDIRIWKEKLIIYVIGIIPTFAFRMSKNTKT